MEAGCGENLPRDSGKRGRDFIEVLQAIQRKFQ